MKWSKNALVIVVIILLVSLCIETRGDKKLSREVKENAMQTCREQQREYCELIERYHDECFEKSHRSEYRVKQFYYSEYNRCLQESIKRHAAAQ